MNEVQTIEQPKIIVRSLPPFKILNDLPQGTNTVVLIGGRGGAKTREVSKYVAFWSTIKKKRCVVLRDEKELIRESILNEILLRFDKANENGVLGTLYERLDTGIKDRATNQMLVFSKGFRASDLTKTANLKSISDIDIAVIEEAEDIRDVDKWNTFADSIRKEGSLIIIILNTPDINHWLIKRYFNLEVVEDGYFILKPKKLPGFVCIQTSFEDNPHLPAHIVSNYNNYGNPESHLYNPHYYKTAIKGWASSGRKGQVHKKIKPIKYEEYHALPFKEYFGQDFGTASPAGLVGVKADKNNCYCRQINYLPMPTLEIAKMYCRLRFGPEDKIIADSADAKAIEKLSRGYSKEELSIDDLTNYPALVHGFYIQACIKGKDSLDYGIQLMDGLNLFAVEESTDLWAEINNRVYARDKNDNFTNEPEPGWDHCFVGSTKIMTEDGEVRIEDIQTGMRVLTTDGFKKITQKFSNGFKDVCTYCINFNGNKKIQITCTPNHKIQTSQGWIPISQLQSGMTVYLNNHSMGKSISSTKRKDIFQAMLTGCIGMFGSILTVAYQKVTTFTIWMKTRRTIISKISRSELVKNIWQLILETVLRTTQNGQKIFRRKELPLLPIGIKAPKGLNGIESRQKLQLLLQILSAPARNVGNYMSSGDLEKVRAQRTGIVLDHVGQNSDANQALTMKTGFALFAVRSSSLIDIEKPKHAEGVAVVSLTQKQNLKKELVYDLSIEDKHEYFANNLLVHNCIDPWMYTIVDIYGHMRKSNLKDSLGYFR